MPLANWELNSSNYPILAIPATSTSSEMYSAQGALNINKLRNRLNKDTFNYVMCLKAGVLL
jgi:hypothetical protein